MDVLMVPRLDDEGLPDDDIEPLFDPMAELDVRIRALYALKERYQKTKEGVKLLFAALPTTDSVLLQHELLYNVGQCGLEDAVPQLIHVASNAELLDVVTRHEAIEAMGAIGSAACVPFLQMLMQTSTEAPIRESCDLALRRLQTLATEGARGVAGPPSCHFTSVDPSPPFHDTKTFVELRQILLDESAPLWERYRAMFTLRNLGTSEAVEVLCVALLNDTSSCLFRHEVAFVLGQLEHSASEEALSRCVADRNEHPMVRHEAAEALGALAVPSSLAVLSQFAEDRNALVRDSCVVGLEMHKYWSAFRPATDE